MKEEVKTRLKGNWKKLGLAIVGLGTLVYFIITGDELDLSWLIGLLQ